MLETLFADAHERGLVFDGLVAQNAAQRAQFWAVRETIPEANKRIGAIASHDVSVPLGLVPEFIERGDAQLAEVGDFRINCFGHLGDGNLHYNMFPHRGQSRDVYNDLRGKITEVVHELVAEMGGSFSAEHGIGRMKVADLARYGDPAKLAMMRGIKGAFDPDGIMNPGVIFGA